MLDALIMALKVLSIGLFHGIAAATPPRIFYIEIHASRRFISESHAPPSSVKSRRDDCSAAASSPASRPNAVYTLISH